MATPKKDKLEGQKWYGYSSCGEDDQLCFYRSLEEMYEIESMDDDEEIVEVALTSVKRGTFKNEPHFVPKK